MILPLSNHTKKSLPPKKFYKELTKEFTLESGNALEGEFFQCSMFNGQWSMIYRNVFLPHHGDGVAHDVGVVEGERGQGGEGEPLGTGGVVETLDGERGIDKGEVGGGDTTATWVAAELGIDTDETDGLEAYLYTGLLTELTDGTLVDGFVHLHEAAREGPAALEGFVATLDEEHAGLRLTGDDDAVGGDGRAREFVSKQ